MFKLFGNKKRDKNYLSEIKKLKGKNRLLYLKALEKYDTLKIS